MAKFIDLKVDILNEDNKEGKNQEKCMQGFKKVNLAIQ